MPDGVLLDTTFLITFANPNAKNHAVARRYFDHFVDESVPMFLSTIALSTNIAGNFAPKACFRRGR
ncbi:MAG: hypothetical protein HY736_17365 [Verrucomicrobia bacterium]|nr:hypothetical protein [Verrucomicrobiota bacterium]